jgi:hypothetical protein
MPKFPKPFFRTARNAWFVQVAGKQVNLGPDRDKALRSYHNLMGRPKADPPPIRIDTDSRRRAPPTAEIRRFARR